jgi:predicted AlkP superfamily pyrophosphatase or phosphodiesterase
MRLLSRWITVGALSAAALSSFAGPSEAAAPYKHVLLISIDGLHAIDLANYVAKNPTSTLASLAHAGVIYPNAMTTSPRTRSPACSPR